MALDMNNCHTPYAVTMGIGGEIEDDYLPLFIAQYRYMIVGYNWKPTKYKPMQYILEMHHWQDAPIYIQVLTSLREAIKQCTI